MGARALYIGETVYRLHGTNQPQTIGSAVSSGCFQLVNNDIIDLLDRVPARHENYRQARAFHLTTLQRRTSRPVYASARDAPYCSHHAKTKLSSGLVKRPRDSLLERLNYFARAFLNNCAKFFGLRGHRFE